MAINKIINPEPKEWTALLKRPTQNFDEIVPVVEAVFKQVKKEGDLAVTQYTEKFDGATLTSYDVTEKEITAAAENLPADLKKAIALAKKNIAVFHEAQRTERVSVETVTGVTCWQDKKPIPKVGLYIPGGTAPLFSTILMLAVPAQLAGCKEIILCSPPNKNGTLHPAILYTAELCGVTKIYKVGGIQAIAAMTFGTETIPKVDKIFGPGNQYVTVAKQLSTRYNVAIDMPAGPSELLVVADDTANAAFVASDLLSQAEHGIDSQVLLISLSIEFMDKVEIELEKQLEELPRKEIATKAIANSRFIYVESDEIALEIINDYAPEHFIICTENEDFYSNGILNAGSVFIGNYTPESAGDYASGTNHTLPTNGFARQYSGVNLDSFLKVLTFQKILEEGIDKIGPAIEIMAAAEGLIAHKNAVSVRLQQIKEKQ